MRPVFEPRFFWERTRAFRSVFPEGALGSVKQKTHFREEVGFGEFQSLLSYSTSRRAVEARFVVVTWLICQEETACMRTAARGQSRWSAVADRWCMEQFMEVILARSVPTMGGR